MPVGKLPASKPIKIIDRRHPIIQQENSNKKNIVWVWNECTRASRTTICWLKPLLKEPKNWLNNRMLFLGLFSLASLSSPPRRFLITFFHKSCLHLNLMCCQTKSRCFLGTREKSSSSYVTQSLSKKIHNFHSFSLGSEATKWTWNGRLFSFLPREFVR